MLNSTTVAIEAVNPKTKTTRLKQRCINPLIVFGQLFCILLPILRTGSLFYKLHSISEAVKAKDINLCLKNNKELIVKLNLMF